MRSDTVDRIRDRIDVVDLVSKRVPLKRTGRNYKGLCPFHSEKTPSFVVFTETQSYHCFGCGKSGDIFTYYMETEGVDFRGALTELAEQAGVEMESRPYSAEPADPNRDSVLRVLEMAVTLFHEQLGKSEQAGSAREYLEKRGLDRDTIEQFQIGYAPAGGAVKSSLVSRGVSPEIGLEAGVLGKGDQGDYYDRFRNRIMFPIHNREGRIVGFGGRALTEDQQPKYLNSPQSALFNKSALLYGLHMAKDAIRSEDRVVIVEGYMDVLTAHQFGYANVVGAMGTAITEQQIDLVKRLSKRIVLALDADSAGAIASLRALSSIQDSLAVTEEFVADPVTMFRISRRLDGEIAIVELPAGEDPDSIIRADPDEWERIVDTARPYIEFIIAKTIEGIEDQDADSKRHAVNRLAPVLHRIPDEVSRAHYAEFLARSLGLRYGIVQAQVDRAGRRPGLTSPGTTASVKIKEIPFSPEDHLIALLLKFRPAIMDIVLSIDPTLVSESRNRTLLAAMKDESTADLDVETFVDSFDPILRDHCLTILEPLASRAAPLPGVLREEILQTIGKIEREAYETMAAHVRQDITEAQREGDQDALINLIALLEQLPELHEKLKPRKSPYFMDTQWPPTRRAKTIS